jgi:hypothetical protein
MGANESSEEQKKLLDNDETDIEHKRQMESMVTQKNRMFGQLPSVKKKSKAKSDNSHSKNK